MEINRDDYFNNFDAAKAYRKLIYIAGRPLQSAELNEAQDIILHLLGSVGKYLVSNGTILSGGEITSVTPTSISINGGLVAIDGIPTDVEAGTVTTPEDGISVVGVAVRSILITGNDDPEILEPDPQSPHFGNDGAYREKVIGTWKTSLQVSAGEMFFPVLTVSGGVILSSSSSTTSDNAVAKAISAYDKGVHGSYVVDGLSLSYVGVNEDTSKLVLAMSSGTARVDGYEARFPLETMINLDPITETRSVLSEPLVFSTGVSSYALRNSPIEQVTSVSGTKQISKSITRGAASGGLDTLPDTPVLSIVSVSQGGTTYTKDVDYKQTGDSVDWSLAGVEPAPGSTYTVVYRYIDNFNASFSGSNLVLDSGDVSALVNGTTLYVDYRFYLSRIDRIMVDGTGAVVVTKGVASVPSSVQEPSIPGGAYLSLGTARISFGNDPIISQFGTVYMVPFSQVKDMQDRMADMEYNIAQLSLKDVASSFDPVTNKKGIIVDSLLNENMRDLGVAQTALVSEGMLQLATNFQAATTDSSATYSLPVATEFILLQNLLRTESKKINPYAAPNAPIQGIMNVSPSIIQISRTVWAWSAASTVLDTARSISVSLSIFDAGETITLRLRGAVVGTVVANAQGKAVASVTLPPSTPSGSYEITATGETSGARATGVVNVDISVRRVWPSRDPLAQTFLPGRDCDINAVSVFVTEKPGNTLVVKLVPVELGIPDSAVVLGTGMIKAADVALGWNKVQLALPARVFNGKEYAVIVSTDSTIGSIATAKVGKYDTANATWVKSQALDGVLLASANERTWTPIQDEDMTIKIHAVNYQTTRTTKVLEMVGAPDGLTDFLVDSSIDVPAGTTLKYSLKIGAVSYELSEGRVVSVPPIPSSSGPIELWMEMETDDISISPKIENGVTLFAGTMDAPGSYVQRSFNIPNGATTPVKLTVIVDELAPSGSSITVQYQNASSNWVNMAKTSGTAIGDGKETAVYEATGVQQNTSKIRILLNSTQYSARPTVANIRTLIS